MNNVNCTLRTFLTVVSVKNAVQRYNFLVNYANFSGFFCNFAPKFIKYLR